MFNSATKSILVAGLVLALSGCASWRAAFQSWRLGQQPTAAHQVVDAELQKALDRHYAAGAGALARNEVDGAISAWRQYAAVAPVHLAQAKIVRGYLTLLDREAAKRFARQVAVRAPWTSGIPLTGKVVQWVNSSTFMQWGHLTAREMTHRI